MAVISPDVQIEVMFYGTGNIWLITMLPVIRQQKYYRVVVFFLNCITKSIT